VTIWQRNKRQLEGDRLTSIGEEVAQKASKAGRANQAAADGTLSANAARNNVAISRQAVLYRQITICFIDAYCGDHGRFFGPAPQFQSDEFRRFHQQSTAENSTMGFLRNQGRIR
jgi:hypothetical protein